MCPWGFHNVAFSLCLLTEGLDGMHDDVPDSGHGVPDDERQQGTVT